MTARRSAIGAVLVTLGVVTACGGGPVEATRLDRPVEFAGAADAAWSDEAMVAASASLASALVAAGEEENVVVSPLSLQLALAVLDEGASGDAATSLAEVLGLPATGGSQRVADLRALLGAFEGDVSQVDRDNPPESPLVHIADGIFIQPGFPVEDTFLERASAYHLAQVYEADFAGGRAKPVLDAWVTKETGGLLTEAPAAPAPDTLVTLMDAVTFAASWQSPFSADATSDGPFTPADGGVVNVPMMHQLLPAAYAEGDVWRAIELPYTEAFAMRVVLPDGGAPVRWAEVDDALRAASATSVALTMPRWETDTTLDLTDLIAELGLGALLVPGDLDGVFPGAYVSGVAQGATITVAERGTVAAAVTQEMMAGAAAPVEPPVELVLDHPFEYRVVHADTGLVLFAGRVGDPS